MFCIGPKWLASFLICITIFSLYLNSFISALLSNCVLSHILRGYFYLMSKQLIKSENYLMLHKIKIELKTFFNLTKKSPKF
jgi:hypothetical protein